MSWRWCWQTREGKLFQTRRLRCSSSSWEVSARIVCARCLYHQVKSGQSSIIIFRDKSWFHNNGRWWSIKNVLCRMWDQLLIQGYSSVPLCWCSQFIQTRFVHCPFITTVTESYNLTDLSLFFIKTVLFDLNIPVLTTFITWYLSLLNALFKRIVGPILDDELQEKNSWNPERVPTVVTFVCVCVSVRPYAGCKAHLLT